MDAPSAAARDSTVARAAHVAVRVWGDLEWADDPSRTVALVRELDTGVAKALRGARRHARRGGVVRDLGRDVAREDARGVVDGARGERRPVERDGLGAERARAVREGEQEEGGCAESHDGVGGC